MDLNEQTAPSASETGTVVAVDPEEQKQLLQLVAELDEDFPDMEQVVAHLKAWMKEAHDGAYARNTLLAWRSDCRRFANFCQRRGRRALPADVETILEFLQELADQNKSLATIQRTLATLTLLHNAARVPNPCDDVLVKLRMKKVARTLTSRQKQSRGLIWEEIAKYLAISPVAARDYRDRALVLLAYDTKFRSEEIVRVDVEHLRFDATAGSATVLLTKSKTDQEGKGAVVYIAPDTVQAIRDWLKVSRITKGALFRAARAKHQVGDRLRPSAVASVFQRIGLKIGLPPDEIRCLTGHATRVGSTQDQLAHNQDLGVIMQSGRWKDTRMVLRYGERQLAKRSGMAMLAKLQGRAKRAVARTRT